MLRLLFLLPALLTGLAVLAGESATAPVVEFFNPQGSVKHIRQVTVRFSAPMVALGDPRLPAPFAMDCPEAGTGRWADPRTWVLDFTRDLPSGVACRFQLKPEIRTLAGHPLTGQGEFNFNTGGPVVLATLPGEGIESIDERQVFVLALDTATDLDSIRAHVHCEVAGLAEEIAVEILTGEARQAVLTQSRALGYDYFSLLSPNDPDAASQWQGETLQAAESGLLTLQCRRSLPPETEVRLVWGKGIRSATGIASADERVLNFKTRPAFQARLHCKRVNPQAACLPMLPLELSFSAEVPAEQLQAVRLVDEHGKLYPAETTAPAQQPFAHRLRFPGPFPENARLRIELPTPFQDDAGRILENAARFPWPVAMDEYPPLAKFAGHFGIIERGTSGGVLPVTLRNLEPAAAGQQLTVEAQGGVPGQMQRIAESDADIVRWLERVKLAGRRRGQWVKSRNGDEEEQRWKEETGSTSVFAANDQPTPLTVPKPLGEKEFEVIGIPLTQPGFYVVELSSQKLGASLLGESRPRHVATSTLVTNLAVHLKWGREGSVVWVTTLDKAAPVPEARIQISDYCSGKLLWQGQTGHDGLVRVPAGTIGKPHGDESCSEGSPTPLFVSARTDDDLGFTVSDWNQGIQPGDFNLSTDEYQGPEIVHTVFDRTLFQAGETVSMKHYLRRHTLAGFGLPERFTPAFVELTHLGSDQQFRLPVSVDSKGIGETVWRIPREARLGDYQVALTDTQQTQHCESGGFHVEQFRLPTMKAVIQPPTGDLINSENVQLDLFLSYLSGGAASHAPVRLRSLVEPRTLQFNGYPDYQFGGEPVREGTTETNDDTETTDQPRRTAAVLPLTLDAKGVARTTITPLPVSPQAQDLFVEMEYQDANGEMETVARRIPLWPASLNLGIRTDGWVASRDRVRFRVVALNLQGQPAAGQAVTVELFNRKTYSYRKRLIGGFYVYDNRAEVTRLTPKCVGETDAQGLLFCDVQPGLSGEILLQASTRDRQGNTVLGVASAWIAGDEATWFAGNNTDRIDLIPERDEYQPGETVRLQVRMPFREATALVTVEREGVDESFVTTLSGKSPVIEVPVQGKHAPNMFISVLVVRGRVAAQAPWWAAWAEKLHLPVQTEIVPPPTALADLGKPAYRLGNASIKVGWPAHRLEVSVKPDAAVYQPRTTARAHVSVRPAEGGPLPADAEVALAAVDEALLELKPNQSWRLLDNMMNVRPLEVFTATAQMQVVGKRHYGRKAVSHGGGGGRQAARERFDTLLLWKGRLSLNGRSEMDVDIPLNDSLSAFRVVAVAHAGLGLFGTGSGSFQTRQPLMLNSGLPPVVREGDRLSAMFNLRNVADSAVTVQVTARIITEPEARLPPLAPLSLEVPPGEAREVVFPVEIPAGVQRLSWEVTAVTGQDDAQDHLKIEQTVLPAIPVRTVQATLEQLDGALSLDIQPPAGALPGRGGVSVGLQTRLGDALTGVTDYMQHYPYSCLEQKVSTAIALRDQGRWAEVLAQLPVSLDRDGLLRYFPSDSLPGSDVLTSYVLAISHEAGWALPEPSRERMVEGLKKFIGGRALRDSGLNTPDLTLRKLSAIAALSRYAEAKSALLDSLTLDPGTWPTSAVLDWYGILRRVEGIPARDQRRVEAEQILRSRLTYHGSTLGFSTERLDAMSWLMLSGDVNAVGMVLAGLHEPAWQADLPKLARGALGRQQRGRWNMTTANAWGVLAMEQFSARFESVPVMGRTAMTLGARQNAVNWSATPVKPDRVEWPLPESIAPLVVRQEGSGKPWAMVQVKAALPLTMPLSSGFQIKRTVQPVEQKTPGVWTRGDTARVTLELESPTDLTWVAVDDPVPAGATILGKGLGRESTLLTQGERRDGQAWLAYEERRQEGFRAYYQFVPKGSWTVEYTVRFNNPGVFRLPPTHVEALYAPEVFADYPNAELAIAAQ